MGKDKSKYAEFYEDNWLIFTHKDFNFYVYGEKIRPLKMDIRKDINKYRRKY